MQDDQPAPQAEEEAVAAPQEVQDALDIATEGVQGELVENPSMDPEPNEPEPSNEEPETTPEPAADNTPADTSEERSEPAPVEEAEPDEAGVFEPVSAPDPGDFKPGDYSFDITLSDGKTVHITSPEEADQLATRLDEDPSLINASQFMLLGRKTALMEQGIAADKRVYETNKAEYDRQVALEQTRNETISKWDRELAYLTSKGDIPAVASELNTAEAGAKWGTEYKDAPGIKERLELFKFMEQENARRTAAGLDPMTSMLDAYNQLQLERSKTAAVDEEKAERSTRRAKGAMVGGSAPYVPSNVGKNEIVGTGGSLNDILAEYY